MELSDVAALASDDEAGSDIAALLEAEAVQAPSLPPAAAPEIAPSRRAAHLKRAREFKAAFARRAKRDLDKQTGEPAPKLSFHVHSAPRGRLDGLTPFRAERAVVATVDSVQLAPHSGFAQYPL